MKTKRFWISWNEPGDDIRPLTDPPHRYVKHWWKSGEAGDGAYATLCAVVDAVGVEQAKRAVSKSWRPKGWRFVEEKPADWMPEPSRFPSKASAA